MSRHIEMGEIASGQPVGRGPCDRYCRGCGEPVHHARPYLSPAAARALVTAAFLVKCASCGWYPGARVGSEYAGQAPCLDCEPLRRALSHPDVMQVRAGEPPPQGGNDA